MGKGSKRRPTAVPETTLAEKWDAVFAPCGNCGHPASEHKPVYYPTEHVQCRVGGIIEPDDVGWQCRCKKFTRARGPGS